MKEREYVCREGEVVGKLSRVRRECDMKNNSEEDFGNRSNISKLSLLHVASISKRNAVSRDQTARTVIIDL